MINQTIENFKKLLIKNKKLIFVTDKRKIQNETPAGTAIKRAGPIPKG